MTREEVCAAACRGTTLETIWKGMASKIFENTTVSEVQYQEMRKMFYCAFSESLRILSDISEYLPEDEATAKITSLHSECDRYWDEHFSKTKGMN